MSTLKKPDIQRLLAFQQLLLEFRDVKRVVHLPKHNEAENDAEHSYSLALTGWYLAQFFPKLNRDKIIHLALVHDLVEVHAGDTFAYAEQSIIDSKKEREAAALNQLKNDWPDFPEMTEAIHAYEERESEEAKFVYALDKIMPPMVIFLAKGFTWHKEHITLDVHHKSKIDKVALSQEINSYYDQLYELLKAHPHFFPEPKSNMLS